MTVAYDLSLGKGVGVGVTITSFLPSREGPSAWSGHHDGSA